MEEQLKFEAQPINDYKHNEVIAEIIKEKLASLSQSQLGLSF